MKESLVAHLACPDCGAGFLLTVERQDGAEVLEGMLHCRGCAARHPVRRGVPRFVPSDAYVGNFSFQWQVHRTTQVDSLAGHAESKQAFGVKTGLTADNLNGRVVLDVGCGTGRYAEVAAGLGAEVIGVDLSYAIDAAYRNMGRRPRMHFVQADVFKLPFRAATFDAAYSIGVLHHTPSTREAFLNIPPLVKPDGLVAIWVYKWGGDYSRDLDRIRPFTVRLPKRLLYALCWMAVPIVHAMDRVPGLRRVSRHIPTSIQGRGLAWDVLDTFDLYGPRYQWKHQEPEVRRWFDEAGLVDVKELSFPVSFQGRRAEQSQTKGHHARQEDVA
jgi:SAM-dependent methyltransferase